MNLTDVKCSCIGAALALVIGCAPAASQSVSQVVVFGDSTVDSGWYRNAAPNSTNPTYNTDFAIAVTQGGGTATTNPGPINSQLLAGFFGLTANPANTPGGTDYATGDARNAQVNTNAQANALLGAVPTVTQISNYLAANNGVANPNGLYLISSGGNDISFALGLPANMQNATVVGAANALVAAIVQLQAAGARTFIIPDTPQSFGGQPTESLRAAYNTTLWQGLAAARVNFVPADINAMYRAVQASPSTFGLIGGGGPACTQPAGIPSGWSTMCSPTSTISTLVSPDAEYTHLLADDIHLSTAGQIIEADYEYSLITAPTEISLLAEAPVKTRQTMIEAMFTQIGLSQQNRNVGTYNAWISGGVSALGMQSSAPGVPGDPGAPLGATVGFDYAFAPAWLPRGGGPAGPRKPSASAATSGRTNSRSAPMPPISATRSGPTSSAAPVTLTTTWTASSRSALRRLPIPVRPTARTSRSRPKAATISQAAPSPMARSPGCCCSASISAAIPTPTRSPRSAASPPSPMPVRPATPR